MTTRDGESVVLTGQASRTFELSSALSDQAWAQMKHLTLTSPTDSWVRLNVEATARFNGTGTLGSVVKARRVRLRAAVRCVRRAAC